MSDIIGSLNQTLREYQSLGVDEQCAYWRAYAERFSNGLADARREGVMDAELAELLARVPEAWEQL